MNKDNSAIMILSILLLIFCLIAGFFAYKTQNLVKEITKLKSIPTPIVTATPTPDPTADWKTYEYTEQNFLVKYPPTWIAKEIYIEGPVGGIKLYDSSTTGDKLGDSMVIHRSKSGIYSTNEKNVKFNDISFYAKEVQKDNFVSLDYQTESNDEGYILVTADYKESSKKDAFNQILSTFKFIEPVASSSPLPVACTMEAKLCDDGSYVGRSGPKCEFALCPTPKN